VEKDGTLIPYEDALRTLSYISDHQYSQIIRLPLIHKVKRESYQTFIIFLVVILLIKGFSD